jgi:phospholipid N-methyltransferase
MTDTARLSDADVIVEWGTGNGVITERILQKKTPNAGFLAVELNEEFVTATRRRCPTAKIVHDSAAHTRKHLSDHGWRGCDRLVCGLPWAAFPEKLQDDLLDTMYDVLNPGGIFVTFAYLQGLLLPAGQRFRKKLRARFPQVTRTRTIWMNFPPAFVYCVRK